MATPPTPRVDSRDWAALNLGERIQMIEVEGYLVLPDLLTPDEIAALKTETAELETTPVDYSDRQRGHNHCEFKGGALTQLIAHGPTVDFLRELLGPDIIMSHYGYARSEPGHPGISLHTDGQPYGSNIFGFEGSVPVMVRVLYYLDDLTLEVSPFRVIPRSHLSMHADGNPYKRFTSHPEEVMVPCRAGSAVLHGTIEFFTATTPMSAPGQERCWRLPTGPPGLDRSTAWRNGMWGKYLEYPNISGRFSSSAIRGTGLQRRETNQPIWRQRPPALTQAVGIGLRGFPKGRAGSAGRPAQPADGLRFGIPSLMRSGHSQSRSAF